MHDNLEKCYEDTSIFIFRVSCLQATWLSHIIKYLSHLLLTFNEVRALFDPKQPNTYSRIPQLTAMYDSYLFRVEPKSSLEFILYE